MEPPGHRDNTSVCNGTVVGVGPVVRRVMASADRSSPFWKGTPEVIGVWCLGMPAGSVTVSENSAACRPPPTKIVVKSVSARDSW